MRSISGHKEAKWLIPPCIAPGLSRNSKKHTEKDTPRGAENRSQPPFTPVSKVSFPQPQTPFVRMFVPVCVSDGSMTGAGLPTNGHIWQAYRGGRHTQRCTRVVYPSFLPTWEARMGSFSPFFSLWEARMGPFLTFFSRSGRQKGLFWSPFVVLGGRKSLFWPLFSSWEAERASFDPFLSFWEGRKSLF